MRLFSSTAALLIGALLLLPLPLTTLAEHSTLPLRNIDLSRTISLDKSYPRETITATIENVSDEEQDEYLMYFPGVGVNGDGDVGGLEVREAKVDNGGKVKGRKSVRLDVEERGEGVYAAHLPSPLASNSRLTLSITYSLSHSLQPLPRTIEQDDPQFLSFAFPKYIPSLYPTTTQRTTIKIPQGSKLASYSPAQIRGSTLSYGPYDDVSATTTSSSSSEGEGEENVEAETYSLRYENTTPLPHTPLLRRTLTISHTSDSIAHEDAYIDFTNRAANLSHSFSRVAWTVQAWHGLTTTAIKELKILTGKGVSDAWFVDDVGNVSTSHFRRVDGVFEVKPRYPVFGGWRYSFRVGWETALHGFLKKVGGGDEGKGTGEYLLKVPLMEVPANKEGMTIDSLDLRISLPEGSDVLSWELSPSTPKTVIPARSSVVVSQEKDKTFLDTIGRTVLRLQLHNLSDESDGVDVIVRYRLSWFDEVVRKPGVVAVAVVAVVVAWGCVRRVDVGIRRR